MSKTNKTFTISDSIEANWQIMKKYLPADSTLNLPYPGKNFWVCNRDIVFAKWAMTFSRNLEKNQILHILEEILIAGAESRLIIVDYTSQIERNIVNKLKSFIYNDETIYLQDIFRQSVHSTNMNLFENHLNYRSQIRHFAQDRRIYRMITDNLKVILDQTCTHYPEIYRQAVHPLSVGDINLLNSYRINEERSIIFTLHTDIWFPWVKGFGEEEPATTVEALYDNRQLALLHTKRLNQFLLEMQKIANQYGGVWCVETENIPEIYKKMVKQTGIELLPDFHPAT